MTTEARQRYATAIHEAGHWVAAYRLHGPTSCADVSIRADDGRLGHARTEEPFTDEMVEAEIVVLLAGYAAHKRFDRDVGPPGDVGACADYEAAERWTDAASIPGWEARADAFVAEHWTAIVALADALLRDEHLDGDEAEIVVDIHDGEARPGDLDAYRMRRAEFRARVSAKPRAKKGGR